MINLSIKTERLTLRPFVLGDAPHVRELAGAWKVASMCAAVPYPYPQGAAEQWIGLHDRQRAEGAGFPFAVTLQNRLIGCVGLERNSQGEIELGYWFGVPFWGFGYATEAARAAIEFGFGWLGADRLVAGYFTGNPASARVLEKLGFRATHEETHFNKARQQKIPIARVELTRDSWAAKQV